jgi:hypothetical protein
MKRVHEERGEAIEEVGEALKVGMQNGCCSSLHIVE